MEFLKLAQQRYSVRDYKDKEVEKEKLDIILEAGRMAPTAANLQPVKVMVLKNRDSLERLGRAANIYNAPAALVVLADTSKAWIRPFDKMQTTDIDASIVTDHLMLQAWELGIGSVWICYFKPDVLRKEFNIPPELVPVNILALGYARDNLPVPRKIRKLMSDFAIYA